jgi:hypothetical protein
MGSCTSTMRRSRMTAYHGSGLGTQPGSAQNSRRILKSYQTRNTGRSSVYALNEESKGNAMNESGCGHFEMPQLPRSRRHLGCYGVLHIGLPACSDNDARGHLPPPTSRPLPTWDRSYVFEIHRNGIRSAMCGVAVSGRHTACLPICRHDFRGCRISKKGPLECATRIRPVVIRPQRVRVRISAEATARPASTDHGDARARRATRDRNAARE